MWTEAAEKTDVKTEAEAGAMRLRAKGRRGVPAPPRAGRGRRGSPRSLRRGRGPADNWVWDSWLPDCERRHFCCF